MMISSFVQIDCVIIFLYFLLWDEVIFNFLIFFWWSNAFGFFDQLSDCRLLRFIPWLYDFLWWLWIMNRFLSLFILVSLSIGKFGLISRVHLIWIQSYFLILWKLRFRLLSILFLFHIMNLKTFLFLKRFFFIPWFMFLFVLRRLGIQRQCFHGSFLHFKGLFVLRVHWIILSWVFFFRCSKVQRRIILRLNWCLLFL